MIVERRVTGDRLVVSLWPIATKSAYGLHEGSEGVDRTCQISGKAVAIDPSRHIARLREVGRYRDKADVSLVASRRKVYGYTARP